MQIENSSEAADTTILRLHKQLSSCIVNTARLVHYFSGSTGKKAHKPRLKGHYTRKKDPHTR